MNKCSGVFVSSTLATEIATENIDVDGFNGLL